jgi:SAM-dependent methyltransferase
MSGQNSDTKDEDALLPILKLASQHFASQALHAALRLQIPDIMGDQKMSLNDIAEKIGDMTNKDALLRTLRLLTTIQVVHEHNQSDGILFSLTSLGKHFRRDSATSTSLASCICHWMERPLWNSWLKLPEYISGEMESGSPFAMANDGISSDYWYNEKDHPQSLACANDFVRLIHTHEIDAVVNGLDWTMFQNKSLVDVGGHFGNLVAAIANREPSIDIFCLDLPDVISKAPKREKVTFVPGDVLNAATIPSCDVLVMKHFLDKCMWTDDETIQILKNCHGALNKNGTLVIAEAVLPSYGEVSEDNSMPLYLDALYMLVGREGQRTEAEWETLAHQSSFEIKQMKKTNVPSCSLIVLHTV